jgi:hypothetical protein
VEPFLQGIGLGGECSSDTLKTLTISDELI